MTPLLHFALVLWGIVYLLTGSLIMAPVRMALYELLPPFAAVAVYCASCSGFWIGFGLALLGAWPMPALVSWAPLEGAIASAGMMAIVASFVPSDTYIAEQGSAQHRDR